MQLLGWGFGVDHVLRTDAAGSESIYLYVQPNMKTEHTDLTLGLYGERALPGDLKLSGGSTFSTEYDDGENLWRHHELSLSQQRSNGSSELRYSDKRVTGAQTGYETYAVLSHVQRSADGWHLRLSADVDKQDMPDLPRRNLVGYRAELGRETANWSFDLTAEDLFNPELAKDEPTEEITWNRAQALPELKARIKRLHVFGREIPLSADFAWGRLTEDRPVFPTPVRVSTERMHVAAQTEFPRLISALGDVGSGTDSWPGGSMEPGKSSGWPGRGVLTVCPSLKDLHSMRTIDMSRVSVIFHRFASIASLMKKSSGPPCNITRRTRDGGSREDMIFSTKSPLT